MSSIFSLFKKYLDFQFQSGGGKLLVRVIERPGLSLSEKDQEKLVSDLRSIVKTLSIGDLDYGILTGKKESLDRAVITLIYDQKTMRPVAFNALSVMDLSLRGEPVAVTHLGLVVVDPSYRAKGVTWILYGFTTFLIFVKNGCKPYWVSNVTQVPSIIGMVSEATTNTFPNPHQKSTLTYDHIVLARGIMKDYRFIFGVGEEATFDEKDFVIQNAYTGGSDHLKKTYDQAPKHRSEVYNDFCKSTLDYDRGDDFLQLGQVNLFTLLRSLKQSIPKKKWAELMFQLSFVFLNKFFVPLIQWFTVHQKTGELRPCKTLRKSSATK